MAQQALGGSAAAGNPRASRALTLVGRVDEGVVGVDDCRLVPPVQERAIAIEEAAEWFRSARGGVAGV